MPYMFPPNPLFFSAPQFTNHYDLNSNIGQPQFNYPPPPYTKIDEKIEDFNIGDVKTSTIDHIIDEMKRILKRDLNRKMVENSAFVNFETWWEDEELNQKQEKQQYHHYQQQHTAAATATTDRTIGQISIETRLHTQFGRRLTCFNAQNA